MRCFLCALRQLFDCFCVVAFVLFEERPFKLPTTQGSKPKWMWIGSGKFLSVPFLKPRPKSFDTLFMLVVEAGAEFPQFAADGGVLNVAIILSPSLWW